MASDSNRSYTQTIQKRKLNEHHVIQLASVGINSNLSDAADVASLDSDACATVMETSEPLGGGLHFPYLAVDGTALFHRVWLDEPNGATGKFVNSPGAAFPWIPSGTVLDAAGLRPDIFRDVTRPLWVVEGPLEALACLSVGHPAVGLAGVWSGGVESTSRSAARTWRAHPTLRDRVAVAGRDVVILFGSRIAWDPHTAQAAVVLAVALTTEGAAVRVACLPPGPNGQDQGPGHLIGSGALEALLQAVAVAAPASAKQHFEAVCAQVPKNQRQDRVASLLEDLRYLAAVWTLSAARKEAHFENVYKSGGASKTVQRKTHQAFDELVGAAQWEAPENGQRRDVPLTADDFDVVAQIISALSSVPSVFVHKGRLVEVVIVGRARMEVVDRARVQTLGSQCCYLWRRTPNGDLQKSLPRDIAEQVLAARTWPGVRELRGVAIGPLVTLDGRVVQESGYDEGTQLWVETLDGIARVPDCPSREQVELAVADLRSLVRDFPFRDPRGEAVWFAGLVSLVLCSVWEGSLPLFVVSGSAPGLGKTLLAQLWSCLVLGAPLTMFTMPEPRNYRGGVGLTGLVDDVELEKRLGALQRGRQQLVALDNVTVVGGGSLNAWLTGRGGYAPRQLSTSDLIRSDVRCMLCATGINVEVLSETRRRTVCIELETDLADPAVRAGFDQPRLLDHVEAHRPRYLWALLVAVRGYFSASRARQSLVPFGSFEEWDMVREIVLFMGMPDPMVLPAERVDPEAEALQNLIEGFREHGITDQSASKNARAVLRLAGLHGGDTSLGRAVDALVGENPRPAALTAALKRYVNRAAGGWVLKRSDRRQNQGVCFWVQDVRVAS